MYYIRCFFKKKLRQRVRQEFGKTNDDMGEFFEVISNPFFQKKKEGLSSLRISSHWNFQLSDINEDFEH